MPTSPASIDLRSDTVTKPSPGMRAAIAAAEVGDDVLDRDPTTRRLEERMAALLGKEDALFFPTGTQANEAAVKLLTTPGSELLLEADSHILNYELGAVAALWGVQVRPVSTPDGILTADLVRAAIRPPATVTPRASAISIENTHNLAGGKVMPVAVSDAIGRLASELGLPLHLDGARLWNAAAVLGVPLARLTQGATTVMVTFSKGLGCPAGSCLALPSAARRDGWAIRKRLGGGMRQNGILAAAALYALDHHLPRIADDHALARRLADRLAGHPAVRPVPPESNIILLDLVREQDKAEAVLARLAERGVLVVSTGWKRLRAVTHRDVTEIEIDRAAEVIGDVLT